MAPQLKQSPSLPTACSHFPGLIRTQVPFKRYMSLTGRMNGRARVNKFWSQTLRPWVTLLLEMTIAGTDTPEWYIRWEAKYEDWLPDPLCNYGPRSGASSVPLGIMYIEFRWNQRWREFSLCSLLVDWKDRVFIDELPRPTPRSAMQW